MLGTLQTGDEPWSLPYQGAATPEDVFYCFRLLLGRHPHREEWTGHSGRAGEDLASVVASYLDSLEFRRRGLQKREATDIALAELPGFRIHVAADDAAVGRHVQAGAYERDVTAVFRRILKPGMGVLDIGANIGYFTMLSASIVGPAGYVLAIEPNPANARLLEASRRANGFDQVTVSQTAAGREVGLLALNTSYSNGTTSEPAADIASLLQSRTVPCLPADLLAPPDRRIDLIKADVEGAEYNALFGSRNTIARWRPTIISEFSPGLMPGISRVSGEEYLRWLLGLDYEISVIRPNGSLLPTGRAWQLVMDEYERRAVDHIDIVASPVGSAGVGS